MTSTPLRSALPLGLLLAASLLGASEARAETYDEITAPGFTKTVGDKTYSNFTLPSAFSSGSFSFSNTPLERHTFSGTGLGLAGGANYTYSYTVSITTPGESFLEYRTDLQSSSNPLPLGATNSLTNSFIPANVSNSSYPTPGNLATIGGTAPILFTGTIHMIPGGNARVDGFTDSVWQTPGPLPILGAGTAFGFSRKLRQRIKSVA